MNDEYSDLIEEWDNEYCIENGIKRVCVYCDNLCENVMDTVCKECNEALDD